MVRVVADDWNVVLAEGRFHVLEQVKEGEEEGPSGGLVPEVDPDALLRGIVCTYDSVR